MGDAAALDQGLRTVLRELEPYLSELVLIGGWVPYLYRHHGPFGEWDARDTLTRELDVLLDHPLPALRDLLDTAGFSPEGPAVWVRNAAAGEKIEFLTANTGMGVGRGVPVELRGQPGIHVIPLPGLEILRDHTRMFTLPEPEGGLPPLEIRVPLLGAYVINKAATFMQRGTRQDDDGNPKAAKDLLYLRDLMAAPARVVDEIEEEITRIAAGSRQHAESVRTAANHLSLVASGDSHPLLLSASRMLVEREPGIREDEARARIAGYLTDLREILSDVTARYTDG